MTKLYDEIWFTRESYYIVALGNKIIDLNNINTIYKEWIDEKKYNELNNFILNKQNISKDFVKNNDFLKHMGGLQ